MNGAKRARRYTTAKNFRIGAFCTLLFGGIVAVVNVFLQSVMHDSVTYKSFLSYFHVTMIGGIVLAAVSFVVLLVCTIIMRMNAK